MDERQTKTVRRISLAALIGVAVVLFAYSDRSPVDAPPPPAQGDLPDPREVYDPVRADEPLPEGFRQLLGRDGIHPVYQPVFTNAAGVDWPDNTDVIGVAGVEEAKAYPVSHLNFREMVIDDIEGIPILVSW
jgi:hypothetical protein